MQNETTITQTNRRPVASRLASLRPGDQVFVWDHSRGRNLWQEIADTKEVDGRLKLKVVGTNFFFDEALVITSAVNLGDVDTRAPEPLVAHLPAIRELLEHTACLFYEARARTLNASSRLSEGTFDETTLACVRSNFETLRAMLDDALAGLDVKRESPQFTLTAPQDRLIFQALDKELAHARSLAQAPVIDAAQHADLRATLESAQGRTKLLLRAATWREEIKA